MTELCGLGFTVSDAKTGARLSANVHIWGGGDLNFTGATETDGPQADKGFVFANVGVGSGKITITKTGYATREIVRNFPGDQNVDYALEPVAVPRPSQAQMLDVKANFCNVADSDGKPIFSCFLPQAETEGKYDDWMAHLLNAGSTHVTFSPSASYNQYMQPFNWLDQPERFAELVRKVSETLGPNGVGVTPILFLDDGSANPLPRIRQYWPGLAEALRANDTLRRCIVVPAWEPVQGEWSSYELSQALQLMKAFFSEALQGWHGSPTRWVGSSNPVQPDDPWQGGESVFFKSHGGEFVDIVFYQAPADSVVFPTCDWTTDDCWLNRWYDGVIRVGRGVNGWRIIPVCLAEGPAFLYIRGHATSHDAQVWASAGQALADREGVTVSFMNGLPLPSAV